jgi:hypothetical protein
MADQNAAEQNGIVWDKQTEPASNVVWDTPPDFKTTSLPIDSNTAQPAMGLEKATGIGTAPSFWEQTKNAAVAGAKGVASGVYNFPLIGKPIEHGIESLNGLPPESLSTFTDEPQPTQRQQGDVSLGQQVPTALALEGIGKLGMSGAKVLSGAAANSPTAVKVIQKTAAAIPRMIVGGVIGHRMGDGGIGNTLLGATAGALAGELTPSTKTVQGALAKLGGVTPTALEALGGESSLTNGLSNEELMNLRTAMTPTPSSTGVVSPTMQAQADMQVKLDGVIHNRVGGLARQLAGDDTDAAQALTHKGSVAMRLGQDPFKTVRAIWGKPETASKTLLPMVPTP